MKIKGITYKKIRKRSNDIHGARASRDARRNDNGSRRLEQALVGKIGEVVAWKLTGIGEVDFDIYEDGNKHVDFEYDLAKYVHVKTCNSRFKDSPFDSWTVDKRDPMCCDPDPWEIVILCYASVHSDYAEGDAIGFVVAKDVVDLWKPTKKIPHKVAIYKDDIEDLIKPIEDAATYADIKFDID